MERNFIAFVLTAAAFMGCVLLVDTDGLVNQFGLGIATAAFLYLFVRRLHLPAAQVVCAIAVATAGEIFLSLVWGLYSYHHALIPLYVPPGHGLFYALAAATAQQELPRRFAGAINATVLAAGSLMAVVSLVWAGDTWGLLWWCGAMALIWRSRNRLLLSACFVYTILLEWAGTAIGNWRWAAEVPWLRLHSANPPAGVGILYILLDLIVVAISSTLVVRSADPFRVTAHDSAAAGAGIS
jgi:hypothetical protein